MSLWRAKDPGIIISNRPRRLWVGTVDVVVRNTGFRQIMGGIPAPTLAVTLTKFLNLPKLPLPFPKWNGLCLLRHVMKCRWAKMQLNIYISIIVDRARQCGIGWILIMSSGIWGSQLLWFSVSLKKGIPWWHPYLSEIMQLKQQDVRSTVLLAISSHLLPCVRRQDTEHPTSVPLATDPGVNRGPVLSQSHIPEPFSRTFPRTLLHPSFGLTCLVLST